MAGVIGLRGPDIEKRLALRGYKVEFRDADRPFIRPHTGLPVLFVDHGDTSLGPTGAPRVERHVFGFSKRFSSFNARDDKLESGQMWKGMFGKPGHHGVAPVSYILEWGDLGDGQGKRPFRIERADGAAMAVPALVGPYWEERGTRAFALVTIAPNDFVATFHDRMIGQLSDGNIDVWLKPDDHDRAQLWQCLAKPPNDELVAHPLKADVGSAKFNDAAAMAAVGPPVTWDDVKGRAAELAARRADGALDKSGDASNSHATTKGGGATRKTADAARKKPASGEKASSAAGRTRQETL